MQPLQSMRAETALRRLCALPASTFGERLLARAAGRVITFREFITVAREMVRAQPDETATWLAALVALDMKSELAAGPKAQPPPSAN